jgi:BCD family chlorophyll transporter-like MFS transporter
LLTSNFNRIAIYELGIAAVVVTSMLGFYHFLSPFQVIYGRIADRAPIFGYHRTPYVFVGLMLSACAVALLPYVVIPMAQTPHEIGFLAFPYASYVVGFLVLILFGIGFAMAGANHLALVAEVIPAKSRGIVTALIWTMLILGMIGSLQFIRGYMPDYDLEVMKSLYLLSIPVVAVVTGLGLLGVEKRGASLASHTPEHADSAPPGRSLPDFLVDAFSQRPVRNFFLFIFLFQIGYSLQDNILEVFGAEVLGMTVGETGRFQQIWGAGAIFGMFAMGALVFRGSVSKRVSITWGAAGVIVSLLMLAYAAFSINSGLVDGALVLMGFFNGFALVGILTSSMEFTTEEERGAYIGLWGLAIAFATGVASIVAGQLVTSLIESGLMKATNGFSLIFTLEGAVTLVSLWFLWNTDHVTFTRKISRRGLSSAMEQDVA